MNKKSTPLRLECTMSKGAKTKTSCIRICETTSTDLYLARLETMTAWTKRIRIGAESGTYVPVTACMLFIDSEQMWYMKHKLQTEYKWEVT